MTATEYVKEYSKWQGITSTRFYPLDRATAIQKNHQDKFVKPLVLSFSTSLYPSSTFSQYIRKARLEKGLRQKDTARPNDEELFEVVKVGAVAYLSKNTTPEDLAQTIRKVFGSEYPISESLLARPKAAETVLRQFQSMVTTGKAIESVISPLTLREIQVLNYIADGNSNKQIAQILQISEQTIKNHVSSILRKLNANDRAQATAIAIRNGLIHEEAPK